MKTVEITGPIGAGKSSLVRPLCLELVARGVDASPLDDIVRPSRSETALWSTLFAVRRPRLVVRATRAVLGSPIPWWHRRTILGLVLGLGGRLMAARRRVRADACVVVDEGLVHRSVNLFSWRELVPSDEVAGYLATVPVDGPLVYVNASPNATTRRLAGRDLPKRLVGRPDSEVNAFLGRSRSVVMLAAQTMEQLGMPVVRLENRSVARTAKLAADAIGFGLRGPRRVSGRVPPIRLSQPMLVRPDRLVKRALARRNRRLDGDRVQTVLDAYALTKRGRARPVPSPGGRGVAMRIMTPDGEVLLKRYKETVTDQALTVEHAVLEELERLALPSPRLIRMPDGRTSFRLGTGRYAVFEYLTGYRHRHEYILRRRDREAFLDAAGATLAMIHDELEPFDPPAAESLGFVSRDGPRARGVDWFAEHLVGAPAPRWVRAWVERTMRELEDSLEGDGLRRTVVHGDYGPYNLLVKSGHPLVVVDWELARRDWALVDLASSLPRFATRRAGFDVRAARRFIAAYRGQSRSPVTDLHRLPQVLAFLRLQRAVVCWTRAEEDRTWDDEARRRITEAENLLRGADPISSAIRP